MKTVKDFGRTTTQHSAMHIYEMDNKSIRLLIELGDGGNESWMEFPTAELAWGLIDKLTYQIENVWGKRT